MSRTTGIKCPLCGAPVEYDGSSRYVKCEYCGSIVEVASENEIVIHSIDEAEVQKAKTERAVRLKKLDVQMAEDKRDSEHQQQYRFVWFGVVGVCLIAGLLGNEDMFYLAFLAAIIGFFGKNIKSFFNNLLAPLNDPELQEKQAKEAEARAQKAEAEKQAKIDAGYLTIPEDCSIKIFQTTRVQAAVELLKNAGFTNVNAVSLHDLKSDEKQKKDIIDKVTVDGKTAYRGELYPPYANVQVLYHDFTEDYYNNPLRIAMFSLASKLRSKQ